MGWLSLEGLQAWRPTHPDDANAKQERGIVINEVEIEKWLDRQGITSVEIRQRCREAMAKMNTTGKLNLQTVGVKVSFKLEKFDKESSDVPVLLETIESDPEMTRVTTYENGVGTTTIKERVRIDGDR